MKKTLTIRPAREEDIPACTGLLAELFSLEKDFQADRTAQEKGLAMLLASPYAYWAVAQAGTSIVGMITAQKVVSTAAGGYSAWIEDFYVTPEKRSRGIGRALLREIRAWGDRNGVTRYQLVADKDNRLALEFYRRQGWTVLHLDVLRIKPLTSLR